MGRVWFVLWLLVGCSGAQRGGAVGSADIVLYNGDIFTGASNADRAEARAQAIAIRGDRIVAIGSSAELARIAAPRRIDLGGRLVIPGINDAHVHEPSLRQRAREVPGNFDTLTVPDMLAAIERMTREHPAGTWLHAELSRAALDDPSLTREALDRVAPAHPVWIDNFAGHALVLNTAAERAGGLDASAPVPRGGFLGRSRDGAADGWRFEYARYSALRAFGGRHGDEDIVQAVRDFEARAIALGITTVQTFPTEMDPARLDELLRGSPRPVRWHVMRLPIGELITPPYMLALVETGLTSSPELESMVTFYGTKYFLDGTPIERGAALREPYSDMSDGAGRDPRPASGRADWDAAAVREMLSRARASGDPLHLHIAGDAQIQVLLDEMERLGGGDTVRPAAVVGDVKTDWRTQRVVIEHGDGITSEDLARIKALGIVVVQNPSHTMTAELLRARLGERSLRWMPMRSLIEAGIPFALGSDGPLNPFLNIAFATQHPTNPREAITREQALVAYTTGAAYGERTDSFKGKLVPGYVADLAVLSQDIFRVSDDALPRTRSVLTMVAGRIVHDTLASSQASGRSSARTE
jgi:predicted amidohydrolase YtcJ